MSEPVIRVESLSKRYQIGKREHYRTLRDSLANAASMPARAIRAALRGTQRAPAPANEQIWAIKDVSFTVQRGEVVGVIGRNGAGKSTLLKILSRITRPTAGRVVTYGRVAALLEVGTGFHPELSGRENIFLNGAILGMKRAETTRKFDEIVAFAEVERFIDTPVKHYSTGMYMRLAFAVAAHLEPEILIVDEVLAVGDAQFQKRCLGKLGEVAQAGRTVLIVSHQLGQIRRLCERVVWMDGGAVRAQGPTPATVAAYEAAMADAVAQPARGDTNSAVAQFVGWQLLPSDGKPANVLETLGEVTFRFVARVNQAVTNARYGVALYNSENQLMWANSADGLALACGTVNIDFVLPFLPLRPGMYRWLVSLYGPDGLLDLWSCVPDMIVATQPVTHPMDAWQGVLNIPWTIETR